MADLLLPFAAQADYKKGLDKTNSEYIRLHERHLGDPRVGPSYIRFAEDHVYNWLWSLESYEFSPELLANGLYLYPVIAWRKGEDGKREFLTQKEAMPFVRKLGLPEGEQGDVKLGEIGVGYFSRDIIKKWPVEMALKPLEGARPSPRGDDFKQPMRGAQMPAWVGIEQHKAELLSSETSVLAILER